MTHQDINTTLFIIHLPRCAAEEECVAVTVPARARACVRVCVTVCKSLTLFCRTIRQSVPAFV